MFFFLLAGESVEHINRLPPSRSEDTLILPRKTSTPLHRKRATTVNTSYTAEAAASPPQPAPSILVIKKKEAFSVFDEPNSIDQLPTASTVKTSTPLAPVDNTPIVEKETGARKKDDTTRYCVSLFAENPKKLKELYISDIDTIDALAQPLPSTSNPFTQQIGMAETPLPPPPPLPILPPTLSSDHAKKPAPTKQIDSDSFIIGQF